MSDKKQVKYPKITVRVSQEELDDIDNEAEKNGLNRSKYVKHKLFSPSIEINSDKLFDPIIISGKAFNVFIEESERQNKSVSDIIKERLTR